ncbi:amidase family protein [Phenylobacterium terrae]|uniref:Amidase family protein n=1 Tax=Phenylobacterium terrae TaxID=2665495 RepID=A0ABW4N3U8_9CAUL
MADLLARDATAQIAALQAKAVSAVELLQAAVARHEATHGELNAVVATGVERALLQAKAIDELRVRGESLGPLAGLPMTVKDTFDVAGLAASSGLAELRRRQAHDAAAVAGARRGGAVIWGKTNVPVMAADWQSDNALYGATNNPWDLERTPGGSSGGAAAALAARVTALEIGSDIGGSLRVPASFCGVYAHKPSWGLVSQRGHVPPAPGSLVQRDLNVVGPMARSARDLRLLLSLIAEAAVAPAAPPPAFSQLRIGLWLDEPLLPLDPEVREVVEAFAAEAAQAGAQVQPVRSPVDVAALLDAYILLLSATLSEDMPEAAIRRMELMRPGARLARASGAGPFSRAASVLGYTARHREWMAADAVRARLRHETGELFRRFDVLMAPIAPVPAFKHDRRPFDARKLKTSDGKELPYTTMLGWIALATACHLPATAVPAGRTRAGLPVGVQLIGPYGADSKTLGVAQALEEQVRGFEAPPEGI